MSSSSSLIIARMLLFVVAATSVASRMKIDVNVLDLHNDESGVKVDTGNSSVAISCDDKYRIPSEERSDDNEEQSDEASAYKFSLRSVTSLR